MRIFRQPSKIHKNPNTHIFKKCNCNIKGMSDKYVRVACRIFNENNKSIRGTTVGLYVGGNFDEYCYLTDNYFITIDVNSPITINMEGYKEIKMNFNKSGCYHIDFIMVRE